MTLVYQEKLPQPQIQNAQKVRDVAKALGINPNWMMLIMNFESAGTFSTSVVNPAGGATGLIQFMPATAIDLGTTTAALARMSFVEQMDWVLKYYRRTGVISRVRNATDLYLATFFPRAVGKPRNYVLETDTLSAELIARNNPAFDPQKTGKITVGQIEDFMLAREPQWAKKKSLKVSNTMAIGISVAVLVFAGWATYQIMNE